MTTLVALQGCAANFPYQDLPLAGLFMETPDRGSIEVFLENPTIGDGRVVAVDFVLLNGTSSSIEIPTGGRIWGENSWGAHRWHFFVRDARGRQFQLHHTPSSARYANVRGTFTIRSGDEYRIRCLLDPVSSERFEDGAYVFAEKRRGRGYQNRWEFPLTITATFDGFPRVDPRDDLDDDDESDFEDDFGSDFGSDFDDTWGGRIQSSPLVVGRDPQGY